MTDKTTGTVASRLDAARYLIETKVRPRAVPAGRKAARQATDQATRQFRQARVLLQERVIPTVQQRVIPTASSAFDAAMTASAPMRREALRRGALAAAALKGIDSMVVVKKRRRWPVAAGFLALGSAIGAAATWMCQAGRPTQLAPYPLPGETPATMVDLDADRHSDGSP